MIAYRTNYGRVPALPLSASSPVIVSKPVRRVPRLVSGLECRGVPLDTRSLLAEIEIALAASDMSATAFGREAAGDPRLVSDLRKGRELRERLRSRVLAYCKALSEGRA